MIIDGSSFNINRFGNLNDKDAQKLNALIMGLRQKSEEEKSRLIAGGEAVIPAPVRKGDGFSGIQLPDTGYREFAYQENMTAEKAFIDNWSKSTGTKISHSLTFSAPDNASVINSSTVDPNSIRYNTQLIHGLSTKNASVSDPNVKGMEQAEFLSYVRENGLDKEINWSETKGYFRAEADFSNLSDYTDFAGAVYAAAEQRIMRDFSGEEQSAELKTLNACFNNAISEYAEGYAEKITEVFGAFGISVDENEIKASVISLMNDKKNSFSSFAAENPDYAGLADSEDKWLMRDIKFMASALRNEYSPEIKNSSFYSENDLAVLGCAANQYRSEINGMGYTAGHDFTEESLGIALSAKYLASESLTEKWGASEKVKEKISALNNNHTERLINKCDEFLRLRGEEFNKAEEYGPLDREVIDEIMNRAKVIYKSSGDGGKALKAAADHAYRLYGENRNNPAKSAFIRYKQDEKTDKDFAENFYDNGNGNSYMGRLMEKWQMLDSALINKDMTLLTMLNNRFFFRNDTPLSYGVK
ncbi:MAG: hypothetical protein IJ416_04255 [Ruminiclostridium sp.]|nr:hypothetical protein [Ruminiclostridium sp.]